MYMRKMMNSTILTPQAKGGINMFAVAIAFVIVAYIFVWFLNSLFGWANGVPYPMNYVMMIVISLIIGLVGYWLVVALSKFRIFKIGA